VSVQLFEIKNVTSKNWDLNWPLDQPSKCQECRKAETVISDFFEMSVQEDLKTEHA